MKYRHSLPLVSLLFGAACFALRLVQNRTGFEPDTGLPVPGNLPALLLPLMLLLAAAAAAILAFRNIPKAAKDLPFSRQFTSDSPLPLTLVISGLFLMLLSGGWEIFGAARGTAVLSADGMTVISTAAQRFGTVTGLLSALSAAALFPGVLAVRRAESSEEPLSLLAVPVCLLVRLIFVYRTHSINPVLGQYYPELLALMLLILGFYALAAFPVRCGQPRLLAFCTGLAPVLALTLLADGLTSPALLALGGAAVLVGFDRMAYFLPQSV